MVIVDQLKYCLEIKIVTFYPICKWNDGVNFFAGEDNWQTAHL